MDQESLRDRLVAAALPFIDAPQAYELANNVAIFDTEAGDLDAEIEASIRRRMTPEMRAQASFDCSDVRMCARSMASAHRRWHADRWLRQWDGSLVGARGFIASGKRGPAFGSDSFVIKMAVAA